MSISSTTRIAALAASLVLLAVGLLPAQEWTRFRGPEGSGIGRAEGLPARWTDADVDWKVVLPGAGHASPVLWGDRIFLAAADGSCRSILCLRAGDGSVEWVRSVEAGPFGKHPRNSLASSTPACDGERVYALVASGAGVLAVALGHDGKELWRREVGPFRGQHGHGTSPALIGGLLVVPCEHDGESSVVALDPRTGEVRWRTPRRSIVAAYGTPCGYDEGGRTAVLLLSQAHGLASLDARTGEPIWEARVFDKRTVGSPIFAGGLAIGSCGSGGGGSYLVAVRAGGKGDVTATHQAWRITRSSPYVPTSIAIDGLLFLWSDIGVVTCVELASGETVWQERVGGSFSGSPVWADGRLYAMSDDGEAVAVAAGRKFEVLGRTALGEPSRSTPAVAGGRIFFRTLTHLVAVGNKAGKIISR